MHIERVSPVTLAILGVSYMLEDERQKWETVSRPQVPHLLAEAP